MIYNFRSFRTQGIDIIADIHGEFDKLVSLLSALGYSRVKGVWCHPSRMVLFLGDYVDRGRRIREVLHLVRRMVEAGNAIALIGNHEYNAIAFHTRDDSGNPLREHSDKNISQHRATLHAFHGMEEEFDGFLEWFKQLPLFLETDHLRAVHACWSPDHLPILQGQPLLDRNFLIASSIIGTPENKAIEVALKGPEIMLPDGLVGDEPDRKEARVRWWGLSHEDLPFSDLAMPPGSRTETHIIPKEIVESIPVLSLGGKPVFFGHYWMPPHAEKQPLAPGICCLDFSCARRGPLVAYRWHGPHEISGEHFFAVPSKS
jgi:hypothetical protein